jgi:DNA-binding transcriptional MerR regulator
MRVEPNSFFEYLELQGGKAELITKSELLSKVRERGYKLSDRQLTFYVSEGLVPRSVRAGSRAGVYPAIVVQLMSWILQMREEGASIESVRELLPIWKFLIAARSNGSLDLGEFEYVARQHVTSLEAMTAIPRLVSYVMVRRCCASCREKIVLVDKAGRQTRLSDRTATVGFAIARMWQEDEDSDPTPVWFRSTRMTLAAIDSPNTDPTTVILGRKPGESLPDGPTERSHPQAAESTSGEVNQN